MAKKVSGIVAHSKIERKLLQLPLTVEQRKFLQRLFGNKPGKILKIDPSEVDELVENKLIVTRNGKFKLTGLGRHLCELFSEE